MSHTEIVSFAEIVAYLGLGSQLASADAGLIQMLKAMIENQVRVFCGHNLTQANAPYVHYLPAPRARWSDDPLVGGFALDGLNAESSVLQMPQLFVRLSGLEVREDRAATGSDAAGAFSDETILELGADYDLDIDESGLSRSGHLIRHGLPWPEQPRTVKVTYAAGLTASELDGPYSDMKLAVIDEIALRFGEAKSRQGTGGAIQSESIGGEYTVTYQPSAATSAAGGLSDATRARLAPYVKLVP